MLTAHARRGLMLVLGLGFGLGLMAGAFFWSLGERPALTDEQIIARARALGMTRATELPGAKVTIVVRGETSLAELAAMLKTAGAVDDADAFLARTQALRPKGKPLPGAHVVTPGMPLDDLINALVGQ